MDAHDEIRASDPKKADGAAAESPPALYIADYSPAYADAFRRLNEQWITTYFELEPADRQVLYNPDANIIRPGGHIVVALANEDPVGVVALIPHGERCFELAKMAVAPSARGRGIGRLLGDAAVRWARSQGADRLYLESNTKLLPALSLYRKLGFQPVEGGSSPYRRADICMELRLI